MQAIFSCKMYKASSRKSKIRAAMQNPINTELVQQLSQYLDDEYKKPKVDDSAQPSDTDVANSQKDESSKQTVIRPSEHSGGGGATPPPASHVADHHLSDMLKDEESGGTPPDFSQPTDQPEKSEKPVETESVGESTRVQKPTVTASEIPQTCAVQSLSEQTDSIMGLLNSIDSTAGVRLVAVKGENELWIYYKDAINLNTVMEPAIATLNSADYAYLDFNRLARTDNAIVFEISRTPKNIAPVSGESNE
ncbi:MAG: hypothetical protein IJE78_13970 [Bacteroidaceae bacterium]|nr:hypothetical protein [Bacteroidaceae bacterium]